MDLDTIFDLLFISIYVWNCFFPHFEWLTKILILEVKLKKDAEVRIECHVNKARILYFFFTDSVFEKWLVTNRSNLFNVFKSNNNINRRKQHLNETYINKPHMHTMTMFELELCLQNKERALCIMFITQYLTFKFWQSIKKINYSKYQKLKTRKMSSNRI